MGNLAWPLNPSLLPLCSLALVPGSHSMLLLCFGVRCQSSTLSLELSVWTMFKRTGEEDSGEVSNGQVKKSNLQLEEPLNVTKWIEENKSSFLPPVCNKLMWVQRHVPLNKFLTRSKFSLCTSVASVHETFLPKPTNFVRLGKFRTKSFANMYENSRASSYWTLDGYLIIKRQVCNEKQC